MSTLAELITMLRIELSDNSSAIWSDSELTQTIRHALRTLNQWTPRRASTSIDSLAQTREYDLSTTCPGLITILDVWYPYNATDPSYPVERCPWSTPTPTTLRLEVNDEPSGSAEEQIHIIYTAEHTIKNLNSATTTTLTTAQEYTLLLGAAAQAALLHAQTTIGQVNPSNWTPRQLTDWAAARYEQFIKALRTDAAHEAITHDARISWKL